VLRAGVMAGAGAVLAGAGACARRDERPVVTLYTSMDAGLIEPVLRQLEGPGFRFATVTDTEATKTTGLVQRLLAERDQARADLWWSGEALGSVALARAGVLAPLLSTEVLRLYTNIRDQRFACDPKNRWFGLASRPRVVAYDTRLLTPERAPGSLMHMLDRRADKPVAVANPAFGTTRGYFAAMLQHNGRDKQRAWLDAMKGKWRVVDSNSAVVRAVAQGECALGLTDIDDVVSAQAQGWPVGMSLVPIQPDPATSAIGAMATPGTVGKVAGGPLERAGLGHVVDEAASAIISERTEMALASSVWTSTPLLHVPQAQVDARLKRIIINVVNWDLAADVQDEALAMARESMGV
jgi:iron(III) transport system substrate-binding protein